MIFFRLINSSPGTASLLPIILFLFLSLLMEIRNCGKREFIWIQEIIFHETSKMNSLRYDRSIRS